MEFGPLSVMVFGFDALVPDTNDFTAHQISICISIEY